MVGEATLRLLGPVTLVHSGGTVDLGPAKQRAVLAALALEPGSLVSTERLIEMVWGDAAPSAARKAVQVYVSHLRRILPAGRLVSRKPGYLLDVPPEAVDLHRFRALVAKARDVDAGQTRSLLASAEQLWRGEPFDGLGDVPALANLAAGLLEERLSVTEWRLGLEIDQGSAAEAVARLRALVVAHPLREPLHVLLMLALLRTGRAGEALAAYGDLRAVLAEELGIEPGPKAADLHLRILRSETRPPPPSPDPQPEPQPDPEPAEDAQPPETVATFDPPVPPAQLPYDVVDFVGRTDELAGAERILRDGYEHVPIVVLAGQPGVGKTALAVRLGHRMRADFPDGQLFADLGGARPVPADPAETAAAMLRALGVPAPAPGSLAERTAMLRSALAGRRVLMVLDDAADAAQVRPLLPGRAGSAVVVTSRRTLADLEGARIVRLDVLTDEASVELLRSLVGVERTAGEPQRVRRITAMCGNLPLGLRIAGARLASRPAWSLRHFAERLAHRGVLDELRVGDLGIRATFELSFARLDAEQARAVRLLAVPDWADFSPLSAAALLGRQPRQAELLLEELLDIHLLRQPAPGRYAYHDLIGSFARQLDPETEEPSREAEERSPEAEERSSALARLVGYHLHAVYRAVALLVPGVRLDPPSVAPPAVLPQFADHTAALAWLHAEHAAVAMVAMEAVRAARAPLPDLAVLVVRLGAYVKIAGAWRGWQRLADEVLAAAEESGERGATVYSRTGLAGAHLLTGQTLHGPAAPKRRSVDLDLDLAELVLREPVGAHRPGRDRQDIAQTLAELAVLRDGAAAGTVVRNRDNTLPADRAVASRSHVPGGVDRRA
ncbi:AfsR/SARP family transcriptional regulator [Plantactinospora endophytica]|uniref:OmpR/PhoB-type domain-containing protein n=1 Tax=Plantactinospora endophytica TaxID=673535 RepID=A0ABQ4EAW6_9ACTN|nr:BTAD domain-containing putative transcriptional regulator [Plantactinospora endophytica]GIG91426.1 hypothetical protein Pen02_63620 [Plantactinospora endophytica]